MASRRIIRVVAVITSVLVGCVVDSEPPTAGGGGDTNELSETEICEIAINAIATQCAPPTTPLVQIDGGNANVLAIDDPQVGAQVGIGPAGVLLHAGSAASADYLGRIIVQNGTCTVACVYPCNPQLQDMCSVTEGNGNCVLCSNTSITPEGCAEIIAQCLDGDGLDETGSNGGSASGASGTTGTSGTSNGTGSIR
jgi:hypothetical protein